MAERPLARVAAEESVATRFPRIMKATTSPLGVLTDPPLVGGVAGLVIVVSILLINLEILEVAHLQLVALVAALPIVTAVGVTLALSKARQRVIDWLAAQPFEIENVNALLNGVAQNLVVRFEAEPPDRAEFNALLEAVDPDCFALEYADDEPEVEVRIGVGDSKLNPTGANHRRYRRVQAIVAEALVPLHAERPIRSVRVS
jgi:hypothetical protein